MKSKYTTIVLLTLLTTSVANQAAAQFWKNWFKKKEEPKKHKVVRNPVFPKPGPLKRKLEVAYPNSVMKAHYRIDVLAPLYVDDLQHDARRIPEKSMAGVEFYEGVKLAVDTLNALHYNLDVYVHDISNPPTSTDALIRNKVLDSSDLIIGAVQSRDISVLANYAKKRTINFISALSPSDGGVKDNPYFILLQPTLQTHCSYLVDKIVRKYPKKDVVLYHRTSVPVDQDAYASLVQDSDRVHFRNVLCNAMPAKAQLEKLFDSTRTNVVVMATLETGYAEVLLKQLYQWFPRYKFDVYGMPSWKSMSSLRKPDAYPNVTVYVSSPFYYDITTPVGQALTKAYAQAYGGKPGELVFRSYETMFWYAYLLSRYGTIFNKRFSDNTAAPFTKFEIKPEWNKEADFLYNENQHLYLYKYQSSSYIVEQ